MGCKGRWIFTLSAGGGNRTNCWDGRVPRFKNIGCDFKFQKVQKKEKEEGEEVFQVRKPHQQRLRESLAWMRHQARAH